jgi:hypothetical protein
MDVRYLPQSSITDELDYKCIVCIQNTKLNIPNMQIIELYNIKDVKT